MPKRKKRKERKERVSLKEMQATFKAKKKAERDRHLKQRRERIQAAFNRTKDAPIPYQSATDWAEEQVLGWIA